MLVEAAERVIESSLYGGAFPSNRELDRLVAVRGADTLELPYQAQRLVSAASLMALSRRSHPAESRLRAEKIAETWPDPRDVDLPAETAVAVAVALAESYLCLGESVRADEWAHRVNDLARSITDPRWTYRVLGLRAATQAVNGEWGRTEHLLSMHQKLARDQGWDLERADYMAAVAELLICFTSFDAARAARLALKVRALADVELSAGSLAELCSAISLALSDDTHGSGALALRIAQGLTGSMGPGLVIDFAKYLCSYLLLREREPLRAIGFVRDSEAIGNHLLCPHMMRALAALQLRDYREVLAATNDCVRRRLNHSLWNLPLIQLCRAIAHFKLKHYITSIREAASASALSNERRLGSALMVIPPHDLLEVLDYFDAHAPRGAHDYVERLRFLARRNASSWVDPLILPVFSKRERVIAARLPLAASYSEIAAELHVSASTVKSQASSIYIKLGVDGREEAVSVLEQAGYYES